jgi:O-antigen/teichoic acid export membrane protein
VSDSGERPAGTSPAAEATTGRSVLAGGLWNLASYGIPQAYTLVVSIAAARFLGASGTGTQSFISFIALSTTTVLSTSMYIALMRFIGETAGADRMELIPGLLGWAWRIEAAAALVGGGLLVGAGLAGADPQAAWVLAGIASAAGVLHAVPTAVLIGLQRFRQAAMVGLSTGFVGTIAVVLVLWAGGGIVGMFAVEAVVGVANLIWTGTLARGTIGGSTPRVVTEAHADLRRRVLRFAVLSSFGLLLEMVVQTRSEFVFLKHYSTAPQIAFYSIAFSSVLALQLVARSLGSATAPAFATLFGAGANERIRTGYGRSTRLLLLAALPLTAAGLVLGPEAIEVVFGQAFAGAGPPLRILLLVFPLVTLASLANSLLNGLGHVRRPLIAQAAAAVVDIMLALVLIPRLDAKGAAIANAGGQATYAALIVVLAARRIGHVDWRPWSTLRVGVASVGGGLAGWGVLSVIDGAAGLAAASLAALAAFLLLATAVRIIHPDDGAWIEETFGGRLHGGVGRLARLWSHGGLASA